MSGTNVRVRHYQAQAIKLAGARALQAFDPEYRGVFKRLKLLTQDDRQVKPPLRPHALCWYQTRRTVLPVASAHVVFVVYIRTACLRYYRRDMVLLSMCSIGLVCGCMSNS